MRYNISSTLSLKKDERLMAATAIAALAAIIFSAAFALGGRASAVLGGPTCNVPADYGTIQAAVDVPGCSTIKVSQGSYTENITINRSVTLKGAKAGTSINGRTFGAANESKITGLTTIQAAGVAIDGFSITNPNNGLGVLIKTAGDNAVIKNNIVDGIGAPAYPENTVGVYLETGPDNVRVSENKIENISSVKSAQGILVGDSTSNNPSLGIRINANSISDITSTKGAYGIQINNGVSSSATGYTTVKIRDNKIKNLNGGWVHAIGLEGDTPNVIVTDNVITNLTSAGIDKRAINFEDNTFFFTADVSRNSIATGSDTAGIFVHPSLTTLYPTLELDGACNWWGAANGPGGVFGSTATGSGSKVSPGVDISPWLKSGNLNGKCGQKNHHDDDNHHWDHDRGHDD